MLTWTKTPPTEPGWYFYKIKRSVWIEYLGTPKGCKNLYVETYRASTGIGKYKSLKEEIKRFPDGEWAGPIPEPTEAAHD